MPVPSAPAAPGAQSAPGVLPATPAPTNLASAAAIGFSVQSALTPETVLAMRSAPWTMMVHPAALTCRGGRVVPQPIEVSHIPGLNGNGANAAEHGAGAVARKVAEGWIPVPHDIGLRVKIAAFGQARSGAPLSDYIAEHTATTPTGATLRGYTDAWTRPRQLGFAMITEFDREGYEAFLDAIGRHLLGEYSAQQLQMAAAPILREIQDLAASQPTPARLEQLRHRVAQLPEALRPSLTHA